MYLGPWSLRISWGIPAHDTTETPDVNQPLRFHNNYRVSIDGVAPQPLECALRKRIAEADLNTRILTFYPILMEHVLELGTLDDVRHEVLQLHST
jgi:hypothetical protein